MAPEDPARTQSLRSEPDHGSSLPDPVEPFRERDNRIKLQLFVAALTLVNLILLAWTLAEVRDRQEIVEVEGQRCIVVDEEDVTALYCRR